MQLEKRITTKDGYEDFSVESFSCRNEHKNLLVNCLSQVSIKRMLEILLKISEQFMGGAEAIYNIPFQRVIASSGRTIRSVALPCWNYGISIIASKVILLVKL